MAEKIELFHCTVYNRTDQYNFSTLRFRLLIIIAQPFFSFNGQECKKCKQFLNFHV